MSFTVLDGCRVSIMAMIIVFLILCLLAGVIRFFAFFCSAWNSMHRPAPSCEAGEAGERDEEIRRVASIILAVLIQMRGDSAFRIISIKKSRRACDENL